MVILTNFLGPGSSSLASGGVICRSTGSSGGKSFQAPLVVECSDPVAHQEVAQRSRDATTSHLEVVK